MPLIAFSFSVNHENISRCLCMSLFDPRCLDVIVAPTFIKNKPDDFN